MAKISQEEQIIQIARDAAQKVLDTAIETAKALTAATTKDISQIRDAIDKINDKLDNKYVTKEEFSTVKAIAYGLVVTIVLGFMGGLIYLVFKIPQSTTPAAAATSPLISTSL